MADTKTYKMAKWPILKLLFLAPNFGGKADIKSAILGVNFGRMDVTKTDIFGGKNWINCS
jgi:hypothetical protein